MYAFLCLFVFCVFYNSYLIGLLQTFWLQFLTSHLGGLGSQSVNENDLFFDPIWNLSFPLVCLFGCKDDKKSGVFLSKS